MTLRRTRLADAARVVGRLKRRGGQPLISALCAFFTTTSLAVFTTTSSFGQSDEHPALPQGPGRELMIRVCSQCHEPEKVADQQLDRAGWKDVVDQMASKGAQASDAEFDQIVNYLANAFPPSK